jgi:hypothetical protein
MEINYLDRFKLNQLLKLVNKDNTKIFDKLLNKTEMKVLEKTAKRFERTYFKGL